MKTILGIIASPRKMGNCEVMVKAVCRHIDEPHRLNLLRLSDFHLRPCIGCYQCLLKKRRCVLDDDLGTVLDAMADADAYIIAVPVYFLGANAMLKTLLDRGLSFYGRAEQLWGKPSIGIGIAGIEGKEGAARLEIQRFQKMLIGDIKETVIVYGALPGEVFLDDTNLAMAEHLAAAMFADAPAPADGPCCPQCGGDTFRFIDERTVRCMLCSNSGRVYMDGDKTRFAIEKSGHELFSGEEVALSHEQWLIGMKHRYIENRDALKAVTKAYRKDGHWIRPVTDKE